MNSSSSAEKCQRSFELCLSMPVLDDLVDFERLLKLQNESLNFVLFKVFCDDLVMVDFKNLRFVVFDWPIIAVSI